MTTKLTEKNISTVSNLGVNWQSVVVADGSTGLTAVSGRGYFIDTSSGTITITLPSNNTIGNTIILKDYARSWATNNVTIASTLIDGGNNTATFSTNGQTVTLVYMNDTKGWSLINEDTTTNLFPATFTLATGGTITTSTDFKIHTFTGDGSFVVSSAGNGAINPSGGPAIVDYIVVAGGGGGGFGNAGNGGGSGGGAGGFREGKSSPVPSYTASPLATSGITVTTTTYPVTVGAGGVAGSPGVGGAQGSNSVFSTITSAGGGGGGGDISSGIPATTGGSGAAQNSSLPAPNTAPGQGALGNTPPVSPPQGNPGGASNGGKRGGGGGATAAGQPEALTNVEPSPSGTPVSGNIGPGNYGWGGKGGDGATTSISASPTSYAGGGGGGGYENTSGPEGRFGAGGVGGLGGGGNARYAPPGFPSGGTAGSENTGGGGGGGMTNPSPGFAGGKGIVVIRYKFQ